MKNRSWIMAALMTLLILTLSAQEKALITSTEKEVHKEADDMTSSSKVTEVKKTYGLNEDPTAMAFFEKRLESYSQIFYLFWKNIGESQEWALSAKLHTKTSKEETYRTHEGKLTSYIDLKLMKSLMFFSSDVGDFTMLTDVDVKKTLFMSRDTQEYAFEEMDIKSMIDTMKALKTSQKKWNEASIKLRNGLWKTLRIHNLKLKEGTEIFDNEECHVMTFNRGQGEKILYTLYFAKDTGWLRGITLKSKMEATFKVYSNTQGYPSKIKGTVKKMNVAGANCDVELSADFQWKKGKFVSLATEIKTNYEKSIDIKLNMKLELDDSKTLTENTFKTRLNKKRYQLKSFKEFVTSLGNHAAVEFFEKNK